MKKSAFSLIELSIVLIVIGFLVSGVIAGKKLIDSAKLASARSATKSSVVNSMEDIVLWLDATHINGINSDGVVADGSSISSWSDINPISDRKNDLYQNNNSLRDPEYQSNSLNGLPSVYFDGLDDQSHEKRLQNEEFPLSKSMTFFIIAQVQDVSDINDSLLSINTHNEDFQLDAGSSTEFQYRAKTKALTYLHSDITANSGSVDYSESGAHLFGYMLDHNDSTDQAVQLFVNGVQVANTTYLSPFSDRTGHLRIGINRGTDSGLDGNIAEIIIFSDALSVSERQAVEDYLMDKWGIAN